MSVFALTLPQEERAFGLDVDVAISTARLRRHSIASTPTSRSDAQCDEDVRVVMKRKTRTPPIEDVIDTSYSSCRSPSQRFTHEDARRATNRRRRHYREQEKCRSIRRRVDDENGPMATLGEGLRSSIDSTCRHPTASTVLEPQRRRAIAPLPRPQHGLQRLVGGLLVAAAAPLAKAATATSVLEPSPTRSIFRVLIATGSISGKVVIPPDYIELDQSFSAGYVVLSFIVATIGSFCTLELLLRRTSNRGRSNVALLVLAGFSFGAVATFSMHFIGNNALTLRMPPQAGMTYRPLTLAYDAGFTILSLVVSCLAMTLAFFVMGLDANWSQVFRLPGSRSSKRRAGRNGSNVNGEKGSEHANGGDKQNSPTTEDVIALDRLDDAMMKEFDDEHLKSSKDKYHHSYASGLLSKDLRRRMADLEMSSRVGAVVGKLEWALGWSMIDFGGSKQGGRTQQAEERVKAARHKAKQAQHAGERKSATGGTPGGRKESTAASAAMDSTAFSSQQALSGSGAGLDRVGESHEDEPSGYTTAAASSSSAAGGACATASGPGDDSDSDESDDREYSLAEIMRQMSDVAPGDDGDENHGSVSGAASPTTRRSSVADEASGRPLPNSGAVFDTGFKFGSMSSPSTHDTAPPVFARDYAPPLFPRTAPPFETAIPSVYAGRRSSVPANVYGGAGVPNFRDYELPSLTLARIQSLPEGDEVDKVTTRTDDGLAEEAREDVVRQAVEDSRANEERRGSAGVDNHWAKLASEGSSGSSPSRTRLDRRLRREERQRAKHNRASKLRRFLGLDVVTRTEIVKIVVAGTFCGLGVNSLHWIGQLSIVSIPYIAYNVGNVVGSIVIACVAVIAALYIMFIIFRPKLKHGWPSKIITAIILALAVCCMHYCAMAGSHYALKRGVSPPGSAKLEGKTRQAIIGTCAALAFAACLGILAFIIVSQIRAISYRKNRRRVVVASILFDQDDRLLVGPDGVLPMADIAAVEGVSTRRPPLQRANTWDTQSTQSSILDVDLSTGHPAFIAALRSTWGWRRPGIYPSNATLAAYRTTSATPPPTEVTDEAASSGDRRVSYVSMSELASFPSHSPSPIPMSMNVGRFLDRFVTAVTHLSGVITGHESGVRRLGVLYDRVLPTGYVNLQNKEDTQSRQIGKGQLMFLVRRVNTSHERNQLLARNFLFAKPAAVAQIMSRVLAVSADVFAGMLEEQREFCDYGMTSSIKPGRLYAGVCVIQPTPYEGIQVICDRQQRHQLPMREVATLSTSPGAQAGLVGTVEELGAAVADMEGSTLFDMISQKPRANGETLAERLKSALVESLIPMLDSMLSGKAMTRILPRLVVTPCLIPLTPPTTSAPPSNPFRTSSAEIRSATNIAWAVLFKAVLAVDTDLGDVDWEPWALFRAQNECIMGDGRPIKSIPSQPSAADPLDRVRRTSRVQWSASTTDIDDRPPSPRTPDGKSIRNVTSSPSPLYLRSNSVSGPSGKTSLSVQIPRRASVPGVYVEQDIVTPRRLHNEPVREAAPGVATWDSDWLVKMLREQLSRPVQQDDDLV